MNKTEAMIQILTDKYVTTRKEHKCFSCLRKFPVGTLMHFGTFVHDDIYSLYTCNTCEKIHGLCYDDFYDGEGIPQGYVNESLNKDQTPEQYLDELLRDNEGYERGYVNNLLNRQTPEQYLEELLRDNESANANR